MKAAWINDWSGTDGVEIGRAPTPEPAEGELLIRVKAAGVNPWDWQVSRGALTWLVGARLPKVLGWEFSGEVEALGAGCHRFSVGDAVFGRMPDGKMGAFAEYAVVDEAVAAAKPHTLSHVEAAAVPVAGLAAWQALVEVAALAPEQKVLVHGGAGGVGSMAIQLARHLGGWVSTTCSDRNLYYVLDLGVIRSIDYSRSPFETRAPERDVTLDLIGDAITARSIRNARRGGVVISLAGTPDPSLHSGEDSGWIDTAGARWRHWQLARLARRRGIRWQWLLSRADGAQLAQVGALVDAGKLEPQVARIFAFDELREALFMSSGGRMRGKYVVAIDPQVAQGQSPTEKVLKDSRSLFASGAKRGARDLQGGAQGRT